MADSQEYWNGKITLNEVERKDKERKRKIKSLKLGLAEVNIAIKHLASATKSGGFLVIDRLIGENKLKNLGLEKPIIIDERTNKDYRGKIQKPYVYIYPKK